MLTYNMNAPTSIPPPVAAGRSEFRLGWKVLIASLLGVAFGASPLPFNTIGFFIDPLQQEFGWTRTEISFGITIYGVLGALLAPAFGWLADRYGVRRVALGSLTVFGLVFAAFSVIPGNLFWFYVLWTMIGLFGIGSTPITWSRAINLWFFRQRGLALGLTLVGTSVSAMLLPFITTQLIGQVGWRGSFALLALLPLAVALPLGLLWFREPRDHERPPEVAAVGAAQLPGRTVGEAMREKRFWILWISIALISIAYAGALVHLPSMLAARGFDRTSAAAVMSVFGLSIFAGRIITGLLLDRFWAPLVTLPILCLPALSCWVLMGDAPLSLTLAVAAAFLMGFASGAETDLIAYLAGRYFGMRSYGQIYGVLYMAFGLSTAISASLYGWVRDTTGSYDPMLLAAAGMFVAGAVLLLFLGPYPVFVADERSEGSSTS
ncbi:MAG: putative sulfoacetate transporter SauU [Pseudomonadota bacterium]|jgi:MFS family permease